MEVVGAEFAAALAAGSVQGLEAAMVAAGEGGGERDERREGDTLLPKRRRRRWGGGEAVAGAVEADALASYSLVGELDLSLLSSSLLLPPGPERG